MLRAGLFGLTAWFVVEEREPMEENSGFWEGYPPAFFADLMEWFRITDAGWVTAPQCLKQRWVSPVLEETCCDLMWMCLALAHCLG